MDYGRVKIPNNYQPDKAKAKAQQKPNQKIINNFIMWMKFIKFNLFHNIYYKHSLFSGIGSLVM